MTLFMVLRIMMMTMVMIKSKIKLLAHHENVVLSSNDAHDNDNADNNNEAFDGK